MHSRDWDEPRPERRPESWKYQQAERTLGKSPEDVRSEIRSIYAGANNGRELLAALRAKGYLLARGDKDGVLLVVHGPRPGVHVSLTRAAGKDVRKADVEAKTADIDRGMLPSPDEACMLVGDQKRGEARTAEPQKAERWNVERRRLWDEYQAERKQRRTVQWDKQRQKEQGRRDQIRKTFWEKRDKIKTAPANYTERRAALSVVRMEKVLAEQQARELARAHRHLLKREQMEQDCSRYTEFLADKAQGGDEQALAELRWRAKRDEHQEQEKDGSALILSTREPEAKDRPPYSPILPRQPNITYHVERNGDVIYRRNGKDVLADRGKLVHVIQGDAANIETGLRLAQQKFGKTLALEGSRAFTHKAARVAAEAGLNVEFTDARLNTIMAERKAQIASERQAKLEVTQLYAKSQPPANTQNGAQYTGPIQGSDDRYVYQQYGTGPATRIIRHERSRFEGELPAAGERKALRYQNGTIQVTKEQQRQRGRGLGD